MALSIIEVVLVRKMLVGKITINREAPSLIYTHSFSDLYCARERKEGRRRRRTSVFGVFSLMLGVWSLT